MRYSSILLELCMAFISTSKSIFHVSKGYFEQQLNSTITVTMRDCLTNWVHLMAQFGNDLSSLVTRKYVPALMVSLMQFVCCSHKRWHNVHKELYDFQKQYSFLLCISVYMYCIHMKLDITNLQGQSSLMPIILIAKSLNLACGVLMTRELLPTLEWSTVMLKEGCS